MTISTINSDGKWSHNGTVYELAGYFDFFNISRMEIDSPFYIGAESRNINRATLDAGGIYVHSPKMVAILKEFGINPTDSITVPSGRYTFVFVKIETSNINTLEKVSLFSNEVISGNAFVCIHEYLKKNPKIPLLLNQRDMHSAYTRGKHQSSEMTLDFFIERVRSKFQKGYDKHNEHQEERNRKKLQIDKDCEQLDAERVDYQKLSLRKGGHTKVKINDELTCLLPTLPLNYIRGKNKGCSFTEGFHTWFFRGDKGCFRTIEERDLLLGSDISSRLLIEQKEVILSALKI